ncbi:hypothetical protein PRIPAC_97162 [Pristionchus pacificus]|uniref:Uncharacterized protein n=1 Tax=Pristionchus pacificus TaxID=54126 RepID=A0A2A6BD87_PRIPA|nr:hypothetical protein PRIPAC_97162 [Pristionchus pacificus]|eukprot:PDM63845.1 hypothetical protein PRIPAC_49818 [Pristionchus pacificus]
MSDTLDNLDMDSLDTLELSLSPSMMDSTLGLKVLPSRKAFDTVMDSRVSESGNSLEVLLRHCVTGETEWKDIKKCRNYSRTMFHDYFKTQVGEKELLYKEWRKNVNKKRREAFAMAKTGVEKPMKIPKEEKEKEKEIPATPPSPPKEEVGFQTTSDVHHYVEEKVREVMRNVDEARIKVNSEVLKAKADTTTMDPLPSSVQYGFESNHSSDSDDERAHPGLRNKHDPLLNDAYYDFGRHSETRGDVMDKGNNGTNGLASFNSAFSSFSSGGTYGSSYYDAELYVDRY